MKRVKRIRSDYISSDTIGPLLWALTRADKLICELCLQTGWRVDDVLNLRTEQVKHALTLKRTALTITERKTGKRSRKEIPRQLLQDCKEQAGELYVFQGRDDYRKHRTRQAVFLDIKRAAKKFNIKLNLSPHSMRKNYAVYMYHKHGLERVQAELNHDNALVTMLYALSDELTAKHPTGKKNKQV